MARLGGAAGADVVDGQTSEQPVEPRDETSLVAKRDRRRERFDQPVLEQILGGGAVASEAAGQAAEKDGAVREQAVESGGAGVHAGRAGKRVMRGLVFIRVRP